MSDQKDTLEKLQKALSRPGRRSPLFWWLLEQHDWILENSNACGVPWNTIAALVAELGLTSLTGKPAGRETLRTTWKRVRREKARIEAARFANEAARSAKAAANPRRNMPSQFPKGSYGPPLAVVPEKSAGDIPPQELWMGKYWFKEDGFIKVIDGISSAVYCKQQQNLLGRREMNDGIDAIVDPTKRANYKGEQST
jgi:hypothetical protein